MTRAATLAQSGEWNPTPPTSDNYPKGEVLDHALKTAAELRLER